MTVMNFRMHEGEPNSPEYLNELTRQVLAYPGYDEVIMFLPNGGVDKLRLIKTGETELVTYKVGQKMMSFEREVKEPITFQQFESLRDYADSMTQSVISDKDIKDNLAIFQNGSHIEHDPKYDKLRDAIRNKAIQVESGKDDKEIVIDCPNSCTDGSIVTDCDCVTWGTGSSYTDLQGNTITTCDEKTPKEDCTGCGGMGVRSFRCGGCLGAGKIITNPFVTIINDNTEETATFRADIASLVASGFIDVNIVDDTRRRAATQKERQICVGFDATELMVEACSQVGIDLHKDQIVTYWGGRPIEMFATSLLHLSQPMATSFRQLSPQESQDEYVTGILDSLQHRLIRSLRTDMYSNDFDIYRDATDEEIKELAATFDLFMNQDMTIRNYGLRLKHAPSLYGNLQETITILAAHNYRLGYAMTSVATGESGPGLYVMDSSGNVLHELDSGYEIEIVLQNSLNHIRASDSANPSS